MGAHLSNQAGRRTFAITYLEKVNEGKRRKPVSQDVKLAFRVAV